MSLAVHLWESTLCLAAAAIVAALTRHGPARTRYTIWLLASIKFLVPFSVIAAAGQALARLTPQLASPLAGAAGWLGASLPAWNVRTTLAAAADGVPVHEWLAPALAVTWIAGAAALAAWRWWSWRALMRTIGTAEDAGRDRREFQALERACRRWNVHRCPRLAICPAAIEPGVIGVLRPRIVWPAGLTARLDDDQLEAVLAHEVSHVRRRDNAAMLVHAMVETAFWFYPVVWWVGNRLLTERERACDEEVTMVDDNREGYAEALLRVCRFCLAAPAIGAARAGGADLAHRIDRILEPPPAPLSRLVRTTLVTIALLVAGVPMAGGAVGAAQDATGKLPAAAGQAKETEAERPSKDVRSPRLIKETKPVYPDSAKVARIQGNVLLELVVSVDGLPEDIKVTKSLHPDLDAEAVKALEKWRFTPGTKDGKPVRVRVDVEMTFTLK
jgi:bla regulator protein blaR1